MTVHRPFRRRRTLIAIGGMVMVASIGIIADGWQSFGHRAVGARRARMERSPQWTDGHFENPQPMSNDFWGALAAMRSISPDVSPQSSLGVMPMSRDRFATPPRSGLRITWFGHSSTLIELDGVRILTDPVWSERPSPFTWIGPRRWFAPPIALADLPTPHAVIISHDHYDHLDYRTMVAMREWTTTFIVPLGVGAHLVYWGIPESRIVEVDWWQRVPVAGIEIVATPARHASGRHLFDQGATLWSGYAIIGPTHRAYFSGDTGLFPGMDTIGARLGPFDVTIIESGQYHRTWPDWHIGPEQAVMAHRMVRGRVLLPIHWGLFALAYHGWTEPVERSIAAAAKLGVSVRTPRPGESIEPDLNAAVQRWWPLLAWKSGEEDPIVSTKLR